MNKVYILKPKENWVADRQGEEWEQDNTDITVSDPKDADVIWLLADWCWNHIPYEILSKKKVLSTMWHFVPENIHVKEQLEFKARDQIVTLYHAPSLCSHAQIRQFSSKPVIDAIPWVNQRLWYRISETAKYDLREKYKISQDVFLIGSFQRDTLGSDLISPKLEKGPDRFCDAVIRKNKELGGKVEVLLGGWRRQYVIKRLTDAGIPYHYYERANFDVVNEMYNMLDLYIIGSRYEGGPQATVECAAAKVPVISTDCGLSKEILSPRSIFEPDKDLESSPDVDYAFEKVQNYFVPKGYDIFRKIIQGM